MADPQAADLPQLAVVADRLATAIAILDASGVVRWANGAMRALARADGDPAAVARLLEGMREGALELPGGRLVPARRAPLPDGATAVIVPPLAADAGLLRSVLDSLDTSVVVYDADDRYVFGNAAYHGLFPHLPPEEELIGVGFEAMLRRTLAAGAFADAQARDDPEAFVHRRVAEFRAGQPELSERMTLQGRWDLIRTRITGSGLRLSIRSRITGIKRVQEELRAANAKLEADAAQRRAFVEGLGKELRTPLSAVLGYAEMLENEVLGPLETERYRECAALIHHSGRHLLDLVIDLVERSADHDEHPAMREEPIDLKELLRREVTIVQPLAHGSSTQLVINMPRVLPRLLGDARMVRQMLLNLLSNAVRFTVRGIVTVSVRRRADGGIDLEVADTGVGMTPDVVERLGEPFYRGAAEGGVAGTGLGLGVVKELLALHQGSFRVVSAPGSGTSVVLGFPPGRSLPVPA